jgi:RNA polymerase sigma-70 factor (ECF subfamily)
MSSDERLMVEVAAGSEDAFRELLRRYERPISAYFVRRCGTHGRADGEDLFQEVWLRVVRSASTFDAAARFRPWVYRIAQNVFHDWLARRSAWEPESASEPRAEPAAREGAALEAERLLAGLSEEQRDVVMLRYYADLSEIEIGEALGIPRGTVKSRLHTAMSRLAALGRSDTE